MAELWDKIGERLGGLAGKWTGYAAFGSFLIYLFGYLALRFQLSVYGVATSLDVFDEKYLFAGSRFLVYMVSTVPNVLILAIILGAIGYLPYKLIPAGIKTRLKTWLQQWCAHHNNLPLLGVIFAVLFIQFVQRMCFAFVGNALLAKSLPDIWITRVLLSSEGRLSLYMSGLAAGTMITGAIVFNVLRRDIEETMTARILVSLLCFLFAVEVLFLPVNYGVLISTQSLPRVAEIGADTNAPNGREAWLLWDSKDALTYLVRDPGDQRMLVTVPSKDAKIRIVGYDNILCLLFCGKKPGDSNP